MRPCTSRADGTHAQHMPCGAPALVLVCWCWGCVIRGAACARLHRVSFDALTLFVSLPSLTLTSGQRGVCLTKAALHEKLRMEHMLAVHAGSWLEIAACIRSACCKSLTANPQTAGFLACLCACAAWLRSGRGVSLLLFCHGCW